MKNFIYIFCVFFFISNLYATAVDCDNPDEIITMEDLLECNDYYGTYDPNYAIKDIECNGDSTVNTEGSPCVDMELSKSQEAEAGFAFATSGRVSHCGASEKIYCFDGLNIQKHFANEMMLNFLCTDDKIDQGITLAFGPCNLKEEIKISDETSCYCQYVNGEKKNGLAFHCTGL